MNRFMYTHSASPARFVLLQLALLLVSGLAEARPSKFHVMPEPSFHSQALTVTEGAFNQRIDHFNLFDRRKFKQRYWFSKDLAVNAESPVIFYICGETACGEGDVNYMASWANTIHAAIVVIEHRFYGQSQPFAKLTADNLKYLRVSEALADFATVVRDLKESQELRGPWIVVGGSYSGILSSAFRLRYPDLVVGAWASSGPLNVVADYQAYDRTMAVDMGPECSARLRAVTAAAEEAVKDPAAFAELRHRLNADILTDPNDFLFGIADTAAAAVQYRHTADLCTQLASAPDPVTAYVHFLTWIGDYLGYGPTAYSFATAMDDTAGGPNSDLRAFFYQQCTEIGLFQTANKDLSLSVRSQRLDLAYAQAGCTRLFGADGWEDRTEQFRHSFYEPMLDSHGPSEIFFTNGALDPFSPPGIARELGNWTNPRVYASMISTGSHCDDLSFTRQPDDAHKAVHAQVQLLLDKWAIPDSSRRR